MSRTKATKKELAADAAKAMLDQSVAGWGSDASAPTAAGPKDASQTTVKDAAGDAGQEAGKSAAGNAAKKAGTGARRTVRKKTVKADPKADSKDEPKAGPKDEKAAEPKTAGESDKPAEPTAGRSAPAPAPKTEPSVERAQDKPASASEPAKETKPSDDSAGDDLEAPPKREPVIDKLSLLPEEIAAKGNPARDRMEWEKCRAQLISSQKGAMAFYEDATARAGQDGMYAELARINGLTEEDGRQLLLAHEAMHRAHVTLLAQTGTLSGAVRSLAMTLTAPDDKESGGSEELSEDVTAEKERLTAEAAPESRAESRDEAKPESEDVAKPEAKDEAKPEAKEADGKPEPAAEKDKAVEGETSEPNAPTKGESKAREPQESKAQPEAQRRAEPQTQPRRESLAEAGAAAPEQKAPEPNRVQPEAAACAPARPSDSRPQGEERRAQTGYGYGEPVHDPDDDPYDEPEDDEPEALYDENSDDPNERRLARLERERLINEEIGRKEMKKAVEAAERLVPDSELKDPEPTWEERTMPAHCYDERGRLVYRPGRRRAKAVIGWIVKTLVILALCAALAGIGFVLWRAPWGGMLETAGGFARSAFHTAYNAVHVPTTAFVDRSAARAAVTDLARTEKLSVVVEADEAFDTLFVLACAEVARRENTVLFDTRAVIAAPGGLAPDLTEEVRAEIVGRVRGGVLEELRAAKSRAASEKDRQGPTEAAVSQDASLKASPAGESDGASLWDAARTLVRYGVGLLGFAGKPAADKGAP